MKVLIATKQGQGKRDSDFFCATDGELVGFSTECDGEQTDGPCGCRRSFSGLDSFKGTTTAMVVNKAISEDEFIVLYRESQTIAGWLKPGGNTAITDGLAREMLRVASKFKTFSVIEKRGYQIRVRRGV